MTDEHDIAAALKHLGFDSVSDMHYWAVDNNELNRFDALCAVLAQHRADEKARNRLAIEFGEELIFTAQSLRTQPAGTIATFSIEIDGYHREVSVAAKATQ
jgi:hypothetical protein